MKKASHVRASREKSKVQTDINNPFIFPNQGVKDTVYMRIAEARLHASPYNSSVYGLM